MGESYGIDLRAEGNSRRFSGELETKMKARCVCIGVVLCAAWLMTGVLSAAVYHVGPGQALAEPGEVAWESLAAGDLVLIHWRTNAYKAKWVVCRQGTAEAPVIVRGVPGPVGQRPVIDGNGATTRSVLNYWNQPRGVIKIGGANVPPDTTPRYITIESLEIRSGRPPYSFTAANGISTAYPNNAASIYVEKGEHITIRNCVLRDCGNGLFVAAASRDVLVDGNHIYDNGNDGSIYEHNSYTAATGITFQYNHYGPLRTGCPGNNLKDRSAGLVVRYNWIESGNRQLDLVDGEDDEAIPSNPAYRQTYVYGNVLIEPPDAGNRQIVHYGGDSGNTDIYRKGTLYFYNNTIVSTRTDRNTIFRLSTNDEHCDCRNNIIYVSAAGNTLSLLDDTGVLTLSRNWLKPGWIQSFGGTSGTIVNDGSNVESASPGFLDETSQNFRLTESSVCNNAGTNLDSAVPAVLAVTNQYVEHQSGEARRRDARLALGAFEYSPMHAWRFEAFGSGYLTNTASAETADPDADGIPNILEYAFDTDPNGVDRDGLPSAMLVRTNGNDYVAVQFHRRLPPSELAYAVQASTNMVSWNAGSSWSDDTVVLQNEHTTAIDASTNVIVRANKAVEDAPRSFLRVLVEKWK
jgi:hypothetical protein